MRICKEVGDEVKKWRRVTHARLGGVKISLWFIGIVSKYFEGWDKNRHSDVKRTLNCILEPTVKGGDSIINLKQERASYSSVDHQIPFANIQDVKVSDPSAFSPVQNILKSLSLKELVGALDLPISFEKFFKNKHTYIERYGYVGATPSKIFWQVVKFFKGVKSKQVLQIWYHR